MKNKENPPRLLVMVSADAKNSCQLLADLESAGFALETTTGRDPATHFDNAEFDCLIVDWRDADSALSGRLQQCAGRFPVIGIVRADQDLQALEPGSGFDDFCTDRDVSSSAFLTRITRMIARYRNPISVKSVTTPEAGLLQTIVNHSNDWFFIKDLDHRFLAVSEEYAESLQQSMDSVIGKNDLEIGFSEEVVLGSPEADWPGYWPQDDNAVALGEPTTETNPAWRVFAGDTRHRQTIRVPLKNSWGEVYALLVCSEDVTQIVKTEQLLQERNDMLEKVTLEKLKAERSRSMAELAVKAKNKFIATASHDLRQPLHALGLYLDVLETKVANSQELSLIGKIKNSSNALSVLFNSLLDLSRLDAGVVEVNTTDFPVRSLLLSLREEFQEIAADKSIGMMFECCDAIVRTDAVLLERILRNLIQNAVTYTSEGTVEVRCETREHRLRLKIADTGPGIPQYEQNAVFSEYYQLEHDGQKPTIGLGLGLAIVRRLVDLLEVSIELESVPGRGAMFTLDIPLGEAENVVDSTAMHVQPELGGQTVLIIDDEEDILDGMSHVLTGYGCDAVIAESTEQAINILTEKDVSPDMIVADYRLRDGATGDMAIEAIREEFNRAIPAIIVTGDTSADRLKEATDSGFRLLHKPVRPEELIGAISVVLAEERVF